MSTPATVMHADYKTVGEVLERLARVVGRVACEANPADLTSDRCECMVGDMVLCVFCDARAALLEIEAAHG